MDVKSIEAVYENGVFRPLEPVEGLPDHDLVRLVIERKPVGYPCADLIGQLPAADAEEMIRAIEDEFETVNPDDWK